MHEMHESATALPGESPFPFAVPYVRWADTTISGKGTVWTHDRQIYDHELVYILEGNGYIVLDGVRHVALADSLFLVGPRVFHSYESPTEEQRLLGVHFDWEMREDTPRFLSHRDADAESDSKLFRPFRAIENWDLVRHPFLDLRGRPRVRRALEAVIAENHRADIYSPEIAGALLAAALGVIAREALLLNEVVQHTNAPPDAVRRVQRARELLEKPNAPLPSMEEIASSVGWSGDHLRRMCRAILNASPLEIQNAARIRRAQELLRYGQVSIGEIAQRLGWSDASHFTRSFRRATGMAPREWAQWEGRDPEYD